MPDIEQTPQARHGRFDMKGFCITLFLFIKSDLKTIFIPMVSLGVMSSPQPYRNLVGFLRTASWVWLHLLQFCVSNQSLSAAEDTENKPWRPIPSSRISVSETKAFRWILLPICLAVSFINGVSYSGALLSFAIWLNNEMQLDAHWISRNIMNAIGYLGFGSGACIIMTGRANCLTVSTAAALVGNFLIILTTIHAQDFKDTVGDISQGRKTLPILAPTWSRLSMPCLLFSWSWVIHSMCALSGTSSVVLFVTSFIVGGRFLFLRSVSDDQISYLLYNVWLCAAQINILSYRVAPNWSEFANNLNTLIEICHPQRIK